MRRLSFYISIVYIFTLIGCNSQKAEKQILFPRELNSSYQIDPAKDTSLTAENGTIIEIPAHAFIGEDGQAPGGIVELTFVDFYDKSDFVLNRLSTQTTDGRLLQSSGMVYLDANSGSQQLKLKDDKSINVKFRRAFESPAAGLFYGQEDENGVIKWVETGEIYQDTVLLVEISESDYEKENEYEDTVVYLNYKLIIGKDTMNTVDSVIVNYFLQNKSENIIYPQGFPELHDSNEQIFEDYPMSIYFAFQSSQLGWINCDDFINQRTNEFRVNIPEILKNVELYMVFDSLNSVMSGNYFNNQKEDYLSFQVPDNLDITLVAWLYDKEMPLFAMLKSNTSKKIETMKLNPTAADSIKFILQERL